MTHAEAQRGRERREYSKNSERMKVVKRRNPRVSLTQLVKRKKNHIKRYFLINSALSASLREI